MEFMGDIWKVEGREGEKFVLGWEIMYLSSYYWLGLLLGNCNMYLRYYWVLGEWLFYKLV